MKNLEFNQMGDLNGGSCVSSIAFGSVGVVLIAAGPVGWLALGSFALISATIAYDCATDTTENT